MTNNERRETERRANDIQFGGDHYRKRGAGLQHWDIVVLFDLDYFTGVASKYMFRWQDKGGILDLEKAGHYVAKKIEVERARAAGTLTRDILEAALAAMDKVDAAQSSDELRASMVSDAEWDRHRDTKPQTQAESADHCPLCGMEGSHAADCTRRKRAISCWCSVCNTVDGHKAGCTAATEPLVGGTDRAPAAPPSPQG